MTSRADLRIYNRDQGFLGKVDAFRIPRKGADIVVMTSLRLYDSSLEAMIGLELVVIMGLL